MDKRIFAFICSILVFSSFAYAGFYFQDNTFLNSLRMCNNTGGCENLKDTNVSSITNISTVYEVGGDKANVNVWNFVQENAFFVMGFFIVLAFGVFLWKRL